MTRLALALVVALLAACRDAPTALTTPPFLADADVALRIRYLPHGGDEFFREYALAADGRFTLHAEEPGPISARVTGRVAQPVGELFAQLEQLDFFALSEDAHRAAVDAAAQAAREAHGVTPHTESVACEFDVHGHSGGFLVNGPRHWAQQRPDDPLLARTGEAVLLIDAYLRRNCRLRCPAN